MELFEETPKGIAACQKLGITPDQVANVELVNDAAQGKVYEFTTKDGRYLTIDPADIPAV
jgi:hypothetical protein